MAHFTIETDYELDPGEDAGAVARVLAEIVGEQEGVNRTKVYAEGNLVAEYWLEDNVR